VKCLVDAQMVQRHHSDYVVAPNIYLDTKRYEARTAGMHSTCFDIQTRKYEVLESGWTTSGSEHRRAKQFVVNHSENTCRCGVPQLIHVSCPHTIVVCNLLVKIIMCPLYGQLQYFASSGCTLILYRSCRFALIF
jgi:hypothetical protein